jgi:hypothetical protein
MMRDIRISIKMFLLKKKKVLQKKMFLIKKKNCHENKKSCAVYK